jgi:hypothetical protein
MTAMLVLNGVLMVMIVGAILAVLVWGIATDRPWRDFVRHAHLRRSPRPAGPHHPRQPARQRSGAPGLSA